MKEIKYQRCVAIYKHSTSIGNSEDQYCIFETTLTENWTKTEEQMYIKSKMPQYPLPHWRKKEWSSVS